MTEINNEKKREIAPFWYRIIAFLIDSIILGAFGFLLSLVFGDYFRSLLTMGKIYIGLPILLLYFGLLNSKLCSGMSPGKRLLRIKVVDKTGRYLSIPRSFFRTLILELPFILNGTHFPYDALSGKISLALLLIIIFGGGIGIIYLYVFNRRNRQSLHDLVVGSYVVRNNTISTEGIQPIWRMHLVVLSIIFIASIVGVCRLPGVLEDSGESLPVGAMKDIREAIERDSTLFNVNIQQGYTTVTSEGKSTRTNYILASANTKVKINEAYKNKIKGYVTKIVCERYPNISEFDVIRIQISEGLNIGIYSWHTTERLASRPSDCKKYANNEKVKEIKARLLDKGQKIFDCGIDKKLIEELNQKYGAAKVFVKANHKNQYYDEDDEIIKYEWPMIEVETYFVTHLKKEMIAAVKFKVLDDYFIERLRLPKSREEVWEKYQKSLKVKEKNEYIYLADMNEEFSSTIHLYFKGNSPVSYQCYSPVD